MCQFKIRVRGVKIAGRQLYYTGVDEFSGLNQCRIGYNGPSVNLRDLLAQLSLPLEQAITDSVEAIRAKIDSGEIPMGFGLPQRPACPCGDLNCPSPGDCDAMPDAEDDPWHSDENPGTANALSCLPPDVACRVDEDFAEKQERIAAFSAEVKASLDYDHSMDG